MNPAERFEASRAGLTGLCYRMLGSPSDAEDAVQETMLRAWRAFDGFDGRSSIDTWLYRIATNVCLDQLRSAKRRELPTEAGEAGDIDDELVQRPRTHWLEPVPDASALPLDATPERRAELRQSLRLAFVAALQALPPRQRACLLLKEVIGFSSAEVAATLETTPQSVNSALQRARKTLATQQAPVEGRGPLTETQRELLERYVDAFHRYDVDALVSLVREDGTMCMPPYTLWLRGRPSMAAWLSGPGIGCRGSRLVEVRTCGSVGFGQYRRDKDGWAAWALIVLELGAHEIESLVYFLDVERLFPIFELPLRLER